MKRNFVFSTAAFVIAVALVFTGCGGSKKDSGSSGGSPSSGSSNAKAAANATAAALKAIQGTDTAAIVNALAGLAPAAIAELTQKSGSPSGDFEYGLNEAGDGIVITGYTGKSNVVIVPETIEDYPVVEIGDYAFSGRKIIAGVLPGTIKKIGRSAFNGAALTTINLPAGLQEIGDNAFSACKLTNVTFPAGLRKIGASAFAANYSITEVTLPDGIETINAFENCGKLVAVTLPASLKEIGLAAFRGCGELVDITIPDSVTGLTFGTDDNGAANAFENCGKLKLAVRKRLQDLGYTGKF